MAINILKSNLIIAEFQIRIIKSQAKLNIALRSYDFTIKDKLVRDRFLILKGHCNFLRFVK